jgi:hypothetical protein
MLQRQSTSPSEAAASQQTLAPPVAESRRASPVPPSPAQLLHSDTDSDSDAEVHLYTSAASSKAHRPMAQKSSFESAQPAVNKQEALELNSHGELRSPTSLLAARTLSLPLTSNALASVAAGDNDSSPPAAASSVSRTLGRPSPLPAASSHFLPTGQNPADSQSDAEEEFVSPLPRMMTMQAAARAAASDSDDPMKVQVQGRMATAAKTIKGLISMARMAAGPKAAAKKPPEPDNAGVRVVVPQVITSPSSSVLPSPPVELSTAAARVSSAALPEPTPSTVTLPTMPVPTLSLPGPEVAATHFVPSNDDSSSRVSSNHTDTAESDVAGNPSSSRLIASETAPTRTDAKDAAEAKRTYIKSKQAQAVKSMKQMISVSHMPGGRDKVDRKASEGKKWDHAFAEDTQVVGDLSLGFGQQAQLPAVQKPPVEQTPAAPKVVLKPRLPSKISIPAVSASSSTVAPAVPRLLSSHAFASHLATSTSVAAVSTDAPGGIAARGSTSEAELDTEIDDIAQSFQIKPASSQSRFRGAVHALAKPPSPSAPSAAGSGGQSVLGQELAARAAMALARSTASNATLQGRPMTRGANLFQNPFTTSTTTTASSPRAQPFSSTPHVDPAVRTPTSRNSLGSQMPLTTNTAARLQTQRSASRHGAATAETLEEEIARLGLSDDS